MADDQDFPGGQEPELPLAGLDAERPLPPELRPRLEAALLAAVADGLPVPADARGLHQPPRTHAESLDAPRPLPEPLRARLAAALLAEAAATPPAAASLSGEAAAATSSSATGASTPTPPAGSGDSPSTISTSTPPAGGGAVISLESRRRKVVAAGSAVAAVLVLLLAVAGLAGIGDGSGKVEVAEAPTTTTAQTPASLPSETGVSGEEPSPVPPAAAAPSGPATTANTRGRKPFKPSPSTTGPATPTAGPPKDTGTTTTAPPTSPAGGGGTEAAPVQTNRGPAPPFYDATTPSGDASNPPAMTSDPAASSPSPGSQGAAPDQPQRSGSPTTTAAGPALRVGIIPGDAAQEAGFRAYINRLNQNGGVAGHPIELVTVGPGSPAPNTIATANLSTLPVAGPGGAPSWATGPLLETLTATENLLPANGAVFSFASVPERQGHLAADALFPPDKIVAPGTRAVIYVPAAPGPLRDVVPAAIRVVLEERGVRTIDVVTYDPAAHKPLAPADAAHAAFVSLDPADARQWTADAKAAGYRPAAGVAGIYSLADEALLADLPDGARVVSPYVVPGGAEGQAIRSEAGGTSATILHGWATAKSLAAAIWRTGADTPAEVQAALEGLTGWSSGLAPPYETRPGTRSRSPEGVVFQVTSGAFTPQGGFRRDPRAQPI